MPVPEHVRSYAVRLVMATQPGSPYAPGLVEDYVSLGSSPRGAQSLMLAGKVQALLDRRFAVSCDDIAKVALPVLRHRVLTSFRAQSDRVTADQVVQAVLEGVQRPNGPN